MKVNIADKLKSLRKEKNVSQEKLAGYLNVSFQAVSKWENGNACPDISLLPDIARFFGITVDELLQVEKLDEKKLYEEYLKKAYELHINGKPGELDLWIEAYRNMPNNIEVIEMLMSTYYDADKIKYKDEIIDLGTELYNSNVSNYYKGQAICEVAKTYAENGNNEMADKWAAKSFQLMHCQEVIRSGIFEGDEMLSYISFFTYWAVWELFYMANRATGDSVLREPLYKQSVLETMAELYEVLFKNDDMGFEDISKLYFLHKEVALMETELGNDEVKIKKHLTRALELVKKSTHIEEHTLSLPLLDKWHIYDASPENNLQQVRQMKSELDDKRFDSYRNSEWFLTIGKELDSLFE